MGNFLEKGLQAFYTGVVGYSHKDITEASVPLLLSPSPMGKATAKQGEPRLNFRIFSYKQFMPLKSDKIHKWASAKLILTEELIRKNKSRTERWKQCSYFDSAADNDEVGDGSKDNEMLALENYRAELMAILARSSLSRKSKSHKCQKLKRLRRRNRLSKKQNK